MYELIRTDHTAYSSIGELFRNSQFVCYTIEDCVRANGIKVYKETAIPCGRYFLGLNYSTRFKRTMPIIYNSENYLIKGENNIS